MMVGAQESSNDSQETYRKFFKNNTFDKNVAKRPKFHKEEKNMLTLLLAVVVVFAGVGFGEIKTSCLIDNKSDSSLLFG